MKSSARPNLFSRDKHPAAHIVAQNKKKIQKSNKNTENTQNKQIKKIQKILLDKDKKNFLS